MSAAHYHRGLIYLSRGEMDAALADFDASIETAAFTFAEAHVQRALILAERAELDRAATDLETAYQFGPAPLVIQFERAAEARGHFTETPDAEYGEATKAAIPLCLADPDCRSTLAD